MKCYIASRTARAADVLAIKTLLQSHNHDVYDWTMFASIKRPYVENEIAPIAQAELDAIRSADIFILLGDEGGTGMYVEFGYALATNAKIYCVGTHNNVTIFQYLPRVQRVDSIEAVLQTIP